MTNSPFVDDILLAVDNLPPGWAREAALSIPAYQAGVGMLEDVPSHYFQALRWANIRTVADLLSISREDIRHTLGEYDPLPLLVSLKRFLQDNPPPVIFDLPLSQIYYPYGASISARLAKRRELRDKQTFPLDFPVPDELPSRTQLPPGWPVDFVRRVPAYQFGIDVLEMPTRFYRALKRAQIRTIADLLTFTPEDLVDFVYQFSYKGVDLLQARLSIYLSAAPQPWTD